MRRSVVLSILACCSMMLMSCSTSHLHPDSSTDSASTVSSACANGSVATSVVVDDLDTGVLALPKASIDMRKVMSLELNVLNKSFARCFAGLTNSPSDEPRGTAAILFEPSAPEGDR